MTEKSDNHANHSQPKDYPLIVEKDVQIPLRDGSVLYADVFRPDGGAETFPGIMNIGPYQKDKLWRPPADLEEAPNPYMNWETANPMWWCPRGYALIRVDSRGSGKSPGMSEPSSYQEAVDAYDVVEWIAKQPWCNGKVGTNGVSYHAAFQWRLAGLQPPSLKAIIPWEGRADQYRDQAYHGGLFAMGFIMSWHTTNMAHQLLGKPRSYNPDAFNNNMLWHYMRNDLDSGFWRMNSARWELIEVPVYSVGNWSGYSMHLRGNTEAWLCAASKHKKLRIHSGTHFHPFHSEEGRMDQLRFMDYWLKGIDTGIMDEPPVKLQIRTGGAAEPYAFRFEDEWPIARTQWTRFHLDIDGAGGEVDGILNTTPPAQERSVTYGASGSTKAGVSSSSTALMLASKDKLGTSFWTPPMQEDTEVTGPIVLNLWISSTSEDADIVVTLRNIGPDGEDVWEVGQQGQAVPLTKGCLRASHRKLDPKKSLPYRPYHAHDERQWLEPGVPVECQVEVWATCMVFQKGHRIRVDIQPRDGIGSNFYGHYHADYNLGAENTIHSGGDRQSYLLLPLIPPKA